MSVNMKQSLLNLDVKREMAQGCSILILLSTPGLNTME